MEKMIRLSEPLIFAVKHRDEQIRLNSRSGGVFTALSDAFLANNGVVYGCVLNDEFEAVHIRTVDAETRNKMRGSKYIQSRAYITYESVYEDLKAGRNVLFSGTACQITALQSYLNCKISSKKNDAIDLGNLLCVDIVCHGVPSSVIFSEYLRMMEKKNYSRCISIDFRNKKDFGWAAHFETFFFRGKVSGIRKSHSDVFKRLFYSDYITRPSCHQCPYKSFLRPGDVTLGDCWGINKVRPEFNDDKGVSLVIVNSEKGRYWFEKVSPELVYIEINKEGIMQKPLVSPYAPHRDRELFWEDYRKYGIEYVIKKYVGHSGIRILRNHVKILLRLCKYKLLAKKIGNR